jgi:hypothetical protein
MFGPAIFAGDRGKFNQKARFTAFFAVAHPLLNLPGQKSHYEDR